MRAACQRLNEQKTACRKNRGLRDSIGKIYMGAQNKLRIVSEYIQKGFFNNETPEERTVIHNDKWETQEGNIKNA